MGSALLGAACAGSSEPEGLWPSAHCFSNASTARPAIAGLALVATYASGICEARFDLTLTTHISETSEARFDLTWLAVRIQ